MLGVNPDMARGGHPDASYVQSLPNRRMRPAELTRPEDRTPLRQEKPNRRESRLGLRNLFGRSKSTAREPERPVSPTHNAAFTRQPTARTPVTEVHNRPTESRTYHSRDQLPVVQPSRPLSFLAEPPRPPAQHPNVPEHPVNIDRQSIASKPTKGTREDDATWHLPPLFKAYPQAIRNATLSAPTLTADAIIRLSESKGGFTYGTDSTSSIDILQETAKENEREKDKSRRLQRHVSSLSASKFDWTNRIYILSTSGYLLEYGGTGSFDRLPERVVRLSKTSAAFVSDAIPGRHYVLQVSSGIEQDGTPATADSRSILSKLVPRSADRRNAANILMTFDNVEDMNGWMVSLRREIEKLGGRRALSETGGPKEAEVYQQEEDPVQRPLVLRDPNRFSRTFSESFEWPRIRDSQGSDMPPPMTRDPSLDDGSTNSVVSQDGRQLDNLRDSNNRLSYISSGQRTMVSSGSSPTSSPTRDSFPSPCDEPLQNYEIRSRPNAAAILHRRKSLQTMAPFVDSSARPPNPLPNTIPRAVPAMPVPIPMPTPNFSVPRSSNRHYPSVRSPPMPQEAVSNLDRETNRMSRARKPPPMSLGAARPLSMVVDQPSPQPDIPDRSNLRPIAVSRSPIKDEAAPLPVRSASGARTPRHLPNESWQRASSNFLTVQPAPRRMASMSAIRRPGESLPRIRTSMGSNATSVWGHGTDTSEDGRTLPKTRVMQRASMHAASPQGVSRYDLTNGPPASMNTLPPLRAPPPTTPLPPLPAQSAHNSHLMEPKSKALMYRRSMPQLAMGPPSVPPPMSTLPPIPQKPSIEMGAFI